MLPAQFGPLLIESVGGSTPHFLIFYSQQANHSQNNCYCQPSFNDICYFNSTPNSFLFMFSRGRGGEQRGILTFCSLTLLQGCPVLRQFFFSMPFSMLKQKRWRFIYIFICFLLFCMYQIYFFITLFVYLLTFYHQLPSQLFN